MSDHSFLSALEAGELRAAHKGGDGNWVADVEVKQQIIDLFRTSKVVDMGEIGYPHYRGFTDKALFTPREFSPEESVRMVPGGTSVRAGAYIGKRVVIMPPVYINIGAYVDDDTMVDSHVLVGSCAQIGKHVHLSTAVQIGGVLEPIGSAPTVVEDHCMIGAGVILTEGIVVRERAVLAPGVVLSAAVPIYDAVNEQLLKGEIPAGAVVVPGTRPMAADSWGRQQGLSLNCAVIVKYRDDKTEVSVQLEEALR